MSLYPNDLNDIERAQQEMLIELRMSRSYQEQLLSVFNKVASNLETLVTEIRELRRELTPTLDKPKLRIPNNQEE